MSKQSGKAKAITIDISDTFRVPRPQRTESAVRLIRMEVMRRFKTNDVKIDGQVNRVLWKRSRAKPPRRLEVQVRIEEDVAYVEPPTK